MNDGRSHSMGCLAATPGHEQMASPTFSRVPQEGGLVQGWESVCCGVGGFPEIKNERISVSLLSVPSFLVFLNSLFLSFQVSKV